jgi:hypothetical protein
LHHESRNYAEKGCAIEELVFHQVVEAIGTAWRPCASHLDHKLSIAGGKPCLKDGGSLKIERRRVKQ